MRVLTIGGGPGGLYSGILLKKAFPDAEVRILERNQADDTFGWGVVFSDETLSGFEDADAESFKEIRSNFAYWSDIETFYPGGRILSTGHGFCGLSRKKQKLWASTAPGAPGSGPTTGTPPEMLRGDDDEMAPPMMDADFDGAPPPGGAEPLCG